jgi:ABC-type dipeptide/oligopeptide/nickel transport system permease subunit
MNKKIATIGLGMLIIMAVIAIFAPLLAPYDPYTDMAATYLKPSAEHLLGTNDIGQDIFSELLYGARTSLAIGFLSAAISIIIGSVVGMVSGWYGKEVDRFLMKITAFLMTIPFLPTVIIISAFTKPGPLTTSVILGAMSWSGTARIVRSQILSIKNKEYIQTIRAMGASDFYILTRHVLKELLPFLMYRASARVRAGILSESSLSFLGLGSPVVKSWGTIIYYAQAKNALLTDAWVWWILPPGLCIILISCSLTMITYGAEGKMNRRLER